MFVDATSIEVRALVRYCDQVRSPVAYKASRLIASGDWDSLVGMKVSPSKYMSARRYLEDLQVVSLLKKHPNLNITVDRRAVAVRSFFKAEAMCYETNERLNPLLHDSRHYGERIATFLSRWRKEIRRVLGRVPQLSELQTRFGPGSTFNNIGDLITVADKFDSNFTATKPAWLLVSQSFDETAWSRYAASGIISDEHHSDLDQVRSTAMQTTSDFAVRDVEFVDCNRFTTVPKTALTDRGICIEPSINVFYQLGLGHWLSRRMKWVYGWDKENVQQYHRWLARLGSLTGAVATIDLSMASDTVSSNLVKLLLPRDWFDLLDQLRCKKTLIDGRKLINEKFSSMGNGFTFELETLLFYTLARVVTRVHAAEIDWFAPGVDVSCFGDDIIIPTQCVSDMVSALRFFGFAVNQDKSFWSGPFRESCGGDYFRGYDVRPHFQKKATNEPTDLIAFSNGMSRLRRRLDDCGFGGDSVTPSIGLIRNQIPRQIRKCTGPEQLGDLVLWEEDIQRWNMTVRDSKRYIRVWRPVMHRRKPMYDYRPGVVAAFALYFAGSGVSFGQFGTDVDSWRKSGICPRIAGTYVSGYRFGRVAFS